MEKQGTHTNPRLGYLDLEVPMRIEWAAENNLRQRLVELHGHRRDEGRELAAAGIADPGAANAAAEMKADRDSRLGCNRPQWFPVFMKDRFDRVENAKQSALQPSQFGHAFEFVDRDRGVVHR